jgi:small subunit ribosomal protein S4e
MSHLKRKSASKKWPVHKKGTAYIVRPKSNLEKGLPVLIALRDMLKMGDTRKEIKHALNSKQILLDNKPVVEEKNAILIFDTLSILPSKKYYRMDLNEHGKFDLKEIKENETNYKVSKVTDKKMLKGKKQQINMGDGRNLISNFECKINDSVVINFKDKKIEKCLPLKEKAKVAIILGKHLGERGVIEQIDMDKKMAKIKVTESKSDEKEINVLIKQLLVVE